MTFLKNTRGISTQIFEQLEPRLLLNAAAENPPPKAEGDPVVVAISQLQRVTYTDELGRLVTIKLRGPGSGTVTFADEGPGNPTAITLSGTTEQSSLSMKISRAKTAMSDIGTVIVDGSLRSFRGKTTILAGDFTVSGFIGRISIAGVWEVQSTLSIGAGLPADDRTVLLDLGSVNDLSVDCAYGIKTIRAAFWRNNKTGHDAITAPWMETLNIYMDFHSHVTLTDAGSEEHALKSMRAWHVSSVDFATDGYIGKIQVLQWDTGSILAADINYLVVTGSASRGLAGDFGATVTLTAGNIDTLYAHAKIAGAIAQRP